MVVAVSSCVEGYFLDALRKGRVAGRLRHCCCDPCPSIGGDLLCSAVFRRLNKFYENVLSRFRSTRAAALVLGAQFLTHQHQAGVKCTSVGR